MALGLDFAVGSDDHRGADSHHSHQDQQRQYQNHDEPSLGYHEPQVRLIDAAAIPIWNATPPLIGVTVHWVTGNMERVCVD